MEHNDADPRHSKACRSTHVYMRRKRKKRWNEGERSGEIGGARVTFLGALFPCSLHRAQQKASSSEKKRGRNPSSLILCLSLLLCAYLCRSISLFLLSSLLFSWTSLINGIQRFLCLIVSSSRPRPFLFCTNFFRSPPSLSLCLSPSLLSFSPPHSAQACWSVSIYRSA